MRLRPTSRYLIALVALFVVSRLIYRHLGIRFDDWALTNSWQLLPQDLLHHDLVRSLWFLHSQPPLYNAFVGATLQFPHAHGLLNLEFVACSLALSIVCFLTMRELSAPAPLAFVAVALFTISPTTVLYENWMYYSLPVALMAVGAVWCFARFRRTHRRAFAAGTVTLLACMALTRASYHLVFVLAGAVAVVLVARKADRRRVAAVVALPVVVVAGLYVKNFVMFGQPAGSSWLGMNLAHMVLGNQPEAVQADVDSGALSRQALVPSFIDLGGYGAQHAPTGVPALDRPLKEPGVNNYNNIAYIDVSKQYERDALTFIRRHPDLYLRTAGDAFRTMFVPSADFIGVQYEKSNYPPVRRLVELENRMLGQYREYQQPTQGLGTTNAPDGRHIAWVVVAAYLATFVAAAFVLARSLRTRRSTPTGATFVFLAFIAGFSVFSSNLFELGENMRFRLETDPLVLVGATALIANAWARVQRARRRPAPVLVLADHEMELDAVAAGG
jgi:hypothetical protein